MWRITKYVIIFVVVILIASLGYQFYKVLQPQTISDVTQLTVVYVDEIVKPKTIDKLQKIIRNAQKPISVAGARYSQGGQIAYPGGIVIDMSHLNTIKNLDIENKKITIESGATWYEVQKAIDPHNLSVTVMQSYNDFSIGGSLSVNVHARDLAYGPMISSVESIKVVLADGSLVTASRQENYELFKAAIGGYGLMGVIVEATLLLTDNIPLERRTTFIDLQNYNDFFTNTIKTNKDLVFYNVDVFPNQFDQAIGIGWYKTNRKPTIDERLQERKLFLGRKMAEIAVRRIPFLQRLRSTTEKIKSQIGEVVWRNYEMSYSVSQLVLMLNFPTTMTLQEYFIPVKELNKFFVMFRNIINKYDVNVLNLSIRHVSKDNESMLTYSPEETFSVVLYINVLNTEQGKQYACMWTQELVDAALSINGTYYLPYLMCANRSQFKRAYPQFKEFLKVKKKYDPTNKFRNMLYEKYV
jgi:FAD/FMN-containing dehydrogenase